jgi:hypothetical protein
MVDLVEIRSSHIFSGGKCAHRNNPVILVEGDRPVIHYAIL